MVLRKVRFLLLLALEAWDEHLLGPLGSLQVVLEDPAEEIHELLVALRPWRPAPMHRVALGRTERW